MAQSAQHYATILVEPEDNKRIRYIANKHIFQNYTNIAYNSYYLSNIVNIDNNNSVFTIHNGWVGVGATVTADANNVFQVNSAGSTVLSVKSSSVGINTSTPYTSGLSVFGTAYISGAVGIGVSNPTQKLQVEGNVSAYTFRAFGADYAEWEEVDENEPEIPSHGTVIGFTEEGKVTTNWRKSVHFGVVSDRPSLLGNEKICKEGVTCVPIVYLGKIHMDLQKTYKIGSYVVPIDHLGKVSVSVIAKEKLSLDHLLKNIGFIHKHIQDTIYEVIIRI